MRYIELQVERNERIISSKWIFDGRISSFQYRGSIMKDKISISPIIDCFDQQCVQSKEAKRKC